MWINELIKIKAYSKLWNGLALRSLPDGEPIFAIQFDCPTLGSLEDSVNFVRT